MTQEYTVAQTSPGEIWKPTMNLRWVQRAPGGALVLQQQWFQDGDVLKLEWHDVPIDAE